MQHRVETALAALLLSACAASPTPPPRAALEVEVRPLPAERLERVEAEAPEVARRVTELQRLAEAHAARGDAEAARALARAAEVTLLSSSELIARLETSEVRAGVGAMLTSRADETESCDPPQGDEPEEGADERENTRIEAMRRAAAARARQAQAAEEAGEEGPADEAEGIRQRLARLAGRLSELEPAADDAVVVEGVQNRLIEADRALAEGLLHRADELADEAAALLSRLTGEPVSQAPDDGPTFAEEARKHLGPGAVIRGGTIAVQLDPLVRFHQGEWRVRDRSGAFSGVRALVRGYRRAELTLVQVGDASTPELGRELEELRRFLASRFQIPVARLQRSDGASLSLEPGTYLVIDGVSAG